METKHESEDWCGYECNDGQILFYFNKQTGQHKWLSFSQQNNQDATAGSDGPLHPKRPLSVSVGTQTEDSGCINGCTSIYFNKNVIMNVKQEPLDRGYLDDCSKNRAETSCLLGEVNIPQSLDTEICKSKSPVYFEQSLTCNKEDFQVQEEGGKAKQENVYKGATTDEAIATDQTYNVMDAERQTLQGNINHVYTVKPSQKCLRNLKNVSEIIIENPHHYIDSDVSRMSPRHTVEIEVTNGSSSLMVENCANTGSPSMEVPRLETPTGIPRNLSPNGRSKRSPRHYPPNDCSIGIPRSHPSAKVPRNEVDPTIVILTHGLPNEICSRSGQSNQVQSGKEECTMKGVQRDCSPQNLSTGIPRSNPNDQFPKKKVCVATGIPNGKSMTEDTTDIPIEHISNENFTGIPRDHLPNKSSTNVQGTCSSKLSNQVPSGTIGFPCDCSTNESSSRIPRECLPVESSPTDSSGISLGLLTQQQTKASDTSLATGIQHSAPQLTYTHIIHVDTAITSSPLNRSNITAQVKDTPTDYSVMYYDEQGTKASHPKSVSEDRKNPRFRAPPNLSCSCSLCDAILPNTKTFFEHLFNHCDWTTMECALCKKTFSKKYDLERHLKSHASYRPYECIRCGKSFIRSHQLKCHMLTHEKKDAKSVYMAFV